MIVKMLTHLHVMVKHLWCWHICKGGEKGEEKEAKLSLGCCHGGTTTPCSVHRYPYGYDRLGGREQWVALGALPPYPVAPPPLGRCPPRCGRERLELRLAVEGAVCTATGRTVHRLVTAISEAVPPPCFTQERGKPS